MSSLDLSIVNVALVSGGRTADRLGRRHTFFAGIAVFCAGSAVCAAAPVLAVLAAGRTAQAIGAALLVPSSLGLLLEEYPSGLRSLAVSLRSGAGGLPSRPGRLPGRR